ncbi:MULTISPECIES: extracellular solute-binding protein [unclassified Nonomuraea]|uniref:ABC transporter substrate-binding protein n=1 Tax=unclassified Nonomuraea TaxID=2593643 RepID=UPI0033F5CCB4
MRRTSIALLALALTACGGPAAPAGEEFSLPTAAAYFTTACPEPGTKPVTDKELTYWSMWTKDEPQGKVLRYAADCFTRKTGVKVTVQWLGRAYLRQNLLPALNTETVPDLFDQDLTNIRAAITAAGGTRPLDDVLAMRTGDGMVRDVLPAVYRDSPAIRDAAGRPFAVPYIVMGNAWWYDRKKLPDLRPPRSMDDLYALFGDRSVALDGDIGYYAAWYFDQLAARYVGSGRLAEAAQDRTGRLWKTDPGFLRAAEHTARIAGHLVDGWDAGKFPQIQQRWADGDASYLFMAAGGRPRPASTWPSRAAARTSTTAPSSSPCRTAPPTTSSRCSRWRSASPPRPGIPRRPRRSSPTSSPATCSPVCPRSPTASPRGPTCRSRPTSPTSRPPWRTRRRSTPCSWTGWTASPAASSPSRCSTRPTTPCSRAG